MAPLKLSKALLSTTADVQIEFAQFRVLQQCEDYWST